MSDYLIFVIEDSDEDYEVLQWILEEQGFEHQLVRRVDGDEALNYLNSDNPLPDLVWLDLNLPGTDGREVLEAIKSTERLMSIPVVVVTTSSNSRDINECYRMGANSYLVKKVDLDSYMATVQSVIRYWSEIVELPSKPNVRERR